MPFPVRQVQFPVVAQVWPVIHYDTIRQAQYNAAMAEHCGCPGVFLISMDGRDDELDQALMAVKSTFPRLKVGANFLSLGPLEALARSLEMSLDATWTDRPGVTSGDTSDTAIEVAWLLAEHPEHLYFGSVAFKYQAIELFPSKAAVEAAKLGMIATTSGTATGVAIDVAKLAAMRAALESNSLHGAGKLALASGVSPENAHLFTPYVHYLLVSTHISESPDSPMLSEQKLRALLTVVHGGVCV